MGYVLYAFLVVIIYRFFFKSIILQKEFSGTNHSIKIKLLILKTVWIQIRPDTLSGLIWVRTVCNKAKVISQQINKRLVLQT